MLVISNRFECDLISLETCHSSSSAFICVIENESGAKPGQIPCFPSALAAEVLAVTAHANTRQLCLCNVTNYKITQNRSAWSECGRNSASKNNPTNKSYILNSEQPQRDAKLETINKIIVLKWYEVSLFLYQKNGKYRASANDCTVFTTKSVSVPTCTRMRCLHPQICSAAFPWLRRAVWIILAHNRVSQKSLKKCIPVKLWTLIWGDLKCSCFSNRDGDIKSNLKQPSVPSAAASESLTLKLETHGKTILKNMSIVLHPFSKIGHF